MDKKGFWALLASVSKAWKTIFTRTNDSFRYRQAAGDDNILLPEKNGRAVFDTIYGNTVKWNQLVQKSIIQSRTGDLSATDNGDGSYTINGTTDTDTTANIKGNVYVNVIQNHVYYIKGGIDGRAVFNIYDPQATGGGKSNTIFTALTSKALQYVRIYIYAGTYTNFKVYTQLFDLTAMGIDNLTTTDEVEAWLALNVGAQDYYPYDEGSLISFKGQGVRTIKNNVELDRLELDVTKIYGKVNGAGSYVQCFPSGMLSANDVHDTLTASEAVVRIGSVDLSTLNWNLSTPENHVFRNTLSAINEGSVKPASNDNTIANAISPIYIIKSWYSISSTENMVFAISAASNNILTIVNHNYSTISGFKEAMSGVPLYYELVTPIAYTDLIYSEDGGVTGTPLKELAYKVDKYSTEEVIFPESADGSPTSTAIVADIDYQKKGGKPVKFVMWNELIKNGNFVNTDDWTVASYISAPTAQNNVFEVSIAASDYLNINQTLPSYILGHVYYYSFKLYKNISIDNNGTPVRLYFYSTTFSRLDTAVNTWINVNGISTPNGTSNAIQLYAAITGTQKNIKIKEVKVIDLTLMFGAGNEPTDPAEVESIIGKLFADNPSGVYTYNPTGTEMGYEE